MFLKCRKIHRKTPKPDSLFQQICRLNAYNFIKNKTPEQVFLVNVATASFITSQVDQWSKILQIPIEKTYYKLWYSSNSVLVKLGGSTDKTNHNCRLPLQKLITSENGFFENVVFDFMSCSWDIQFLVFWNHSINIESCDFIMIIIKWGTAHFWIIWLWNLSN